MDYYKILEVPREATTDQIKKAYRKLARTNHPDKFPESERPAATAKFQDISKAYEVLSDDQKRRIYDLGGEEALKSGGAGPQGNPFDVFNSFFSGGGFQQGFSNGFPQGFPQGFSHGFSQGFSQGFPGQNNIQKRVIKNKDTVYPISVTLKDVFTGRRKKLKVTKRVIFNTKTDTNVTSDWDDTWETCQTCKGAGAVVKSQQIGPNMFAQQQTACTSCSGTGYQLLPNFMIKETSDIVEIEIVKGVTNGTQVRIPDQGNVIPGTYPGDLVVVLNTESEREGFIRRGNNLLYHQTITLPEALTGGWCKIIDLIGEEKTISYKKVLPEEEKRIPGQGIAGADLIIKFKIDFPDKISKQQRESIRKIFGYTPKQIEKYDFEL